MQKTCQRCHMSITGEAEEVPLHSASGGRPNVYRHKTLAECEQQHQAERETHFRSCLRP
ncbi:hypothetical protein ACH4OX_24235 [Streptomyces roseolus]|uniref:hypothetical protein n=1 Tax=Streptomyces roseolus TaxID=67358 RepID=UPI00378C1B8E